MKQILIFFTIIILTISLISSTSLNIGGNTDNKVSFDLPEILKRVNVFSNLTNLSSLIDTNIPAPNDNDVLTWDSATARWTAEVGAGGGDNVSWNQSWAEELFAGIEWDYNQTTATFNLYNDIWNSTFNKTYDSYSTNVSKNYTKLTFDTYDLRWLDGNASWNQSFATTLYAPNTTTGIQLLINNTIMLFKNIFSLSWSNVTITESQVTDLVHTTDTSASVNCTEGDYFDGGGACFDFNDSVKILFTEEQVVYNASQIVTETGTLDSGDLESIRILGDGDTYNVSEISGTPGFMININVSGVTNFNVVALRGKYEGGAGHTLALELYRIGVGWEERAEITDQNDFGVTTFDVFIGSDFIDPSGNVSLRINHDDAGNINHNYFLDAVFIGQVTGIVSGGDLADLTGRDNACELLPDVFCKDGSKNMTGNLIGDLGINLSFTKLEVDHIAEKTPGHGVVVDNDLDVSSNDIRTSSIITNTIRGFTSRNTYYSLNDMTGVLTIGFISGTEVIVNNLLNLDGHNITNVSWITSSFGNFSNISSLDWSNVSITESQISDLEHTVNNTNINVTSLEVGGDADVTGTATARNLVVSSTNDGDILLTFGLTDGLRPWYFKQHGTGSSVGMKMVPQSGNKHWLVTNVNGEIMMDFLAGTAAGQNNQLDFMESRISFSDGGDVMVGGTLNVSDYIAIGSNSFAGLSAGDINVSTVYYDTLTAKSPQISELKDGSIGIIDWDTLTLIKCNPLLKDDCPIESENKMLGIYEKRENEATCKANNYSWNGECFELVITESNYNNAVEIIQIEEIEIINSTCSRLTSTLQVETYDCSKEVKTGKMINKYQFKENCGWNMGKGYYCEERVLRNVEVGL